MAKKKSKKRQLGKSKSAKKKSLKAQPAKSERTKKKSIKKQSAKSTSANKNILKKHIVKRHFVAKLPENRRIEIQLLNTVRDLQLKEDWLESINVASQLIKHQPEDPQGWFLRGFAKTETSQYESAIRDYDKSIDIDPVFSEAWNNRGLTNILLGNYESALSDLNAAINIDLRYVEAYDNRGLAKMGMGDNEGAVEDFNLALKIDSNFAPSWNNRAIAKLRMHQFVEAIDDFDRSIEIDPTDSRVWSNRGYCKFRLGSSISRGADSAADYLNGSIEDLDKAIELDSTIMEGWYYRSMVKAELRKFDEAIEDIDIALRIQPDNVDIINSRAAILAQRASEETLEDRIGSLAETKELHELRREYREKNEIERNSIRWQIIYLAAQFILGILIIIYLIVIKVIVPEPISLLPWFTMLILITSPSVWFIRLSIQQANKFELLEIEFLHLAYVETRVLNYFSGRDTRSKIEAKQSYIMATIAKSPSEKLLAMNKDKTSISFATPLNGMAGRGTSNKE